MQYRCGDCKQTQWRGYFPVELFHWRYTLFHGIAIGVCGILVRILYDNLGYSMSTLQGGLLSLVIGIVMLVLYYGVAVVFERFVVGFLPCISCGSRKLRADSD